MRSGSPAGDQVWRTALTSIADARRPWSHLAERTANIFSTWEWADTWWRHFGTERSPRIIVIGRGSETAAILPIELQRRAGIWLRRFLGHGVGDQLGPVCGADDTFLATAALSAELGEGGMLLAERMLPARDWSHELGGNVINRDASPIIDLAEEASWEEYLRSRSPNFRQQVRRRARRLRRGLGVTFRLTRDPDRLPADFDALVALHAARWGSDSRAFAGARGAFHREFAAHALRRGWLRLWLAEAEGTPVAAWYGFRYAGVESFYQSGRDPNWDRHGVGAGILEHSISEAFADRMREYRLLRGAEDYKSRYATRDPGLVTVVAARGGVARAAGAAIGVLAGSAGGRRALKRFAGGRR